MNECYLLLGSNLGERKAILLMAMESIEKRVGRICGESAFYESEPWGFEAKEQFLNKVAMVQTNKSPDEVLDLILDIEKELGREKSGSPNYESRKIDIDLLFFNDEIIQQTRLTIPHPRLHLRRFTLMPLAEIAPGLMHPVFKKNIEQLLTECSDPMQVMIFDE
jgi:2-amino-4-hydroxy-6-hydroxymethyldihydropteridine diphosphokinase